MKRKLAAILVAGALMVGLMSGSAFAAQTEPGVPGEPNCKRQTVAYLAQLGGAVDIHGFANVAKALGFTVQELHDLVDSYCAGP
ncbi:MAG: hypothetical protein FJ318_02005 [SAR202 cluster bacterium]|nr:hypothetical protein [SAR202 cluster bacterium]